MSDTLLVPEPVRPQRLNPDLLHRNLTALARVDAPLVQALRRVDVDDWQPAMTRDGRLSFSRATPAGHHDWLGRTTIPAVRARALLHQFDAGRANVLLPGIAEGTEVVELLARLGSHRAVFVWEQDLETLNLALRLHDVEQAIVDERLVVIVRSLESLQKTLLDWLRSHPGHLCPERIMMWPWQQLVDIADVRAAVESAYQAIHAEREQELASLRTELSSLPRDTNALGIFGLHAREELWACAAGLAAAACVSGREPMLSIVQKPGDIHTLVRARRAAQENRRVPSRAILLETTRDAFADLLPADVATASWLTPLGGVPNDLAARLATNDTLAVSTRRLYRRCRDAGLPEERIHLVPPACLSDADASRRVGTAHLGGQCPLYECSIALVSNITSIDPEAYGFHLPTHVQLWHTARGLMDAAIDSFQEQQLETILARAEKKTGLAIGETHIRQTFLEGLRLAAQTLLCRFVVSVLEKASIPIDVHGQGWLTHAQVDPGPLTLSRRIDLAQKARMTIHLDLSGDGTAHALLAAGCGSILLARQTPDDEQPVGLAMLLEPGKEYLPFGTVRELLAAIKKLRGEPELGRRIANASVERCRRDHQPARRLADLEAIMPR